MKSGKLKLIRLPKLKLTLEAFQNQNEKNNTPKNENKINTKQVTIWIQKSKI